MLVISIRNKCCKRGLILTSLKFDNFYVKGNFDELIYFVYDVRILIK